ncbi:MAG: hypothetical protein K6E77_10530 [Lachnospiraceae bacterium]|nr:hypothetical protein [Lachnospiraceae bacterium]
MASAGKNKKKEKKSAGCLFSLLTFVLEMLGMIPGIYVVAWVDETFNSNFLTNAALFTFPILGMVLVALLMGYVEDKITGAKEIEVSELEKREKNMEKEPFEVAPHYGKLFGYNQVQELIENYTFSPFIDENGKELKHVLASDDKKWAQILGGYIPLDLLCGYNEKKNCIYTIDGAIIQLPKTASLPHIKRELKSFFEARGMYYKTMPAFSANSFEELIGKEGSLSKADWSRVRYEWEKIILRNEKNFNELGLRRFSPWAIKDEDGEIFFERVLTTNELKRTGKAVRKKYVDIKDFLVFDKFKNEYSVCNGIELIKLVNDSQKRQGLGFLFECLRDIDEAYFMPAVELIMEYPTDMVYKKMEDYAKKAYESGDVTRLAGILFLSKRMGHETKFIKQKKEEIRQGKEKELNEAITSVTDTRQYLQYLLKE